jgi:sugar phosphate isomerase/epimerase
MTVHAKPVLGAALSIQSLPACRPWLLSRPRDLELQDFFRAEVLDGDWRGVADKVRRLLDGFEGRLGIHGPFWGFKIDSHDPLIRQAVRTRLLQGLEAAETVGASQMVIHSPYSTWDHNNLDLYPGAREAVIERVQATLKDVIGRAEQIGCELVIENIEDKDPHARVQLVRALNSKCVRVSLDTGHALYAHVSTGAPPVDYYVDAAGDLLTHIHLQDADGFADRHWAPGDGVMRWTALFRAIGRLRSNPRLILELRDHGAVAAGAKFLTELGVAE